MKVQGCLSLASPLVAEETCATTLLSFSVTFQRDSSISSDRLSPASYDTGFLNFDITLFVLYSFFCCLRCVSVRSRTLLVTNVKLQYHMSTSLT